MAGGLLPRYSQKERMEITLVKVQKLMALALNLGAGEEEARTAAHAAVRLIHEHKLLKEREEPPWVYTQQDWQLTKEELRTLAESKVDRFVAFLRKKAVKGEFPCFTARCLTLKAFSSGEFHPLDRQTYQNYLQRALQIRVKIGLLGSRPGPKGGYHLVILENSINSCSDSINCNASDRI
jgi:hypothetical protein